MPNPPFTLSSNQADPQSSLLANGLDFLVSSAKHASRDEERSWKYAVLHSWYGMELLLKARLAREHWTLLFYNIDQADKAKFAQGDFRSIDSNQAYNRLRQICNVEIDRNDWKRLVFLRNLSNQVRHYVGVYNSNQAKSLVWKCTNIGIDFCNEQEMLNDSPEIQNLVYEINNLMQEFDDFVDQRLTSIASYPDFTPEVECIKCWQEACTMNNDGTKCHFCGIEIDADTLNQWLADMVYETTDGEFDW